jgi:heptosyltransferase-2
MMKPAKILIIRFSSIGDIVLTTPFIRAVRTKFPDARIDFLVRREFSELLLSHPALSNVLPYDTRTGFPGLRTLKESLRREQYDIVFDLHKSLRSRYLCAFIGAAKVLGIRKGIIRRTLLVRCGINMYGSILSATDRYLETGKTLGLADDGKGPDFFLPQAVRENVSEKTGIGASVFCIGFCPSAKHYTKRWLPERFIELGIRLSKERNAMILLFGGSADAELCRTIMEGINAGTGKTAAKNFAGSMTLSETAAAMERCRCVVTNDSGLMHIASAMKRNIVAVFGSTVKELGFFPRGGKALVVENNNLRCRPCSHIGRESCPKKHFRCMREITTEMVYRACEEMLKD